MTDTVVIGSGPNGLVAACVLARAGRRVVVLEAHPTRAGGAVASEPLTEPGFVHDVGAAFLAFTDSAAFADLDLRQHGLRFARAPFDSCHPARDGSFVAIGADVDATAATWGDDADSWRWLYGLHDRVHDRLIEMLGPLGTVAPLLRMNPVDGLRLARTLLRSTAGVGRHLFRTPEGQRTIAQMAMHVDIGPDDRFGAPIGYMLAMAASQTGFVVPVGGAQAVTDALLAELVSHGGIVRTGARVQAIRTEGRKVLGVTLAGGETLDVDVVLADTSAPALYLQLLPDDAVPGFVKRRMRVFPQGWGAFKVDWALSGPVPWACETARSSAVVHTGEHLDDLRRFTAEARAGEIPADPYLVVGQQSLIDPSRAPEGQHTLYAYSRVSRLDPSLWPGGWDAEDNRRRFADRIERTLEALAPGFGQTIVARRITTPGDLERMSANLVGGDLGGGSNQWYRQGPFRPVFPYFRYRTPVRGVYLCSSYTHPGTGVHGMCGYNAARAALRDL